MRIDSLTSAGGNTTGTAGDVLNKLKPGDTIRAQVLENTGNDITLKLSDGSKISASAMTPVDASNGDYVNFEYKGTIDGKPAFEVVSRNIQPQVDTELENIKNTLAGLNLPVTDKNIELVQALKQQNVPVTADSMSKIIDLVTNNTELKPDTAAFLTAANMSNDKNSIEKLQSLLAGRLKISNDISDLMKLISANDKNSATAVKSDIINNILEKLAAEITSKGVNQINGTAAPNEGNTAGTANAGRAASATNGTVLSNTTVTTESAANVSSNNTVTSVNTNEFAGTKISNNQTVNNNTAVNATADKATGSSVINGNDGTAGNSATISDDKMAGSNGKNTANTINHEVGNSSDNKSVGVTEQISNLLKGGEPLGKADLPLLNSLNTQLDLMTSNGKMSPEELSAVKLTIGEIKAEIFKIQKNEASLNQESAKSIRNFEDAVNNIKNLFVKIDQNSDEINPVKLYKNMDSALHALKSSIQQLPAAMQETAMNIANNVESNVNFINQLNNYSSYVQIPLSIFNKNTTGELYMLKKGSKARKLDASKITVLISLDSNNIGRIDTLLSVDKKNISTNFRLESSEVFGILKENHKQLYTSLLEKGYRLIDFTYRLIDEPINIVNFETEAKKEFIKSPNNIDILI